MIILASGDKIRGDASAGNVIDYTMHGLDNGALAQMADGQLAAATGDLYTADSSDVVKTITLVNTDSAARTINLYLLPNGGTARRILPKDVSLPAGYSLFTDFEKINVLNTSGQVVVTTAAGGGGTVDVISNFAQDRIAGRLSAGSGDSEELTKAQMLTFLNVEDGADVTDATNVDAAGAVMGSDFTQDSGVLVGTGSGTYAEETGATLRTSLGLAIGTDVQAYDADILKADTADVLTAGYAGTPYNAGTKSSGTFTPDEANGNFQYAVNGGAHTLAPPTNNCTLIVQYTNNASAGAITTSGFTIINGDTLTTTDGHDFFLSIIKCNGFSSLTVMVLQ